MRIQFLIYIRDHQLSRRTALSILLFVLMTWFSYDAGAAPAMLNDGRNIDIPIDKIQSAIDFEVGYGFRLDQFDWNIAGDLQGQNPNILSELIWEDLLIHELRLNLRANLRKSIYIKGMLNYGVIVDGDNQDSDYAADDREMEFSRSNNDAGQGSTLDAVCGAGFRFQLGSEMVSVIPLVGYALHRQNLTMTDGYQTVTWDGGPPLGSFSGLDSSYDAKWQGPWIGVDVILDLAKINKQRFPVNIHAGLEYHWADYYAEADWNLRDDFMHPKSFEHETHGTGSVMVAGISIQMHPRCSLYLGYEYEKWSTDEGLDRVFLASGVIAETQLNEVNWDSETYQIGLIIHF